MPRQADQAMDSSPFDPERRISESPLSGLPAQPQQRTAPNHDHV